MKLFNAIRERLIKASSGPWTNDIELLLEALDLAIKELEYNANERCGFYEDCPCSKTAAGTLYFIEKLSKRSEG